MPGCLLKHSHPSNYEAIDCNWLYARQLDGDIRNLKLYPSYPLHVAGKLWKRWKPDFYFEEAVNLNNRQLVFSRELCYGELVAVMTNPGCAWVPCIMESKGWNRSDDSFRLKLAAFLIEYPQIKVYVNRKPATLSPGRRLMAEGLKRKQKRRLVRTWDRKAGRWVTVRLDRKKGNKDRARYSDRRFFR